MIFECSVCCFFVETPDAFCCKPAKSPHEKTSGKDSRDGKNDNKRHTGGLQKEGEKPLGSFFGGCSACDPAQTTTCLVSPTQTAKGAFRLEELAGALLRGSNGQRGRLGWPTGIKETQLRITEFVPPHVGEKAWKLSRPWPPT